MKGKMTIGHEIRTLDNMMKRQFETYEREKGQDELTIMHGRIIGYLYENQQKDIFQRDVENEFSITRSTVACILKLMEQKGYVKREGVKNDARLKKITLTERAKKVHEEVIEDIYVLEKQTKEGISEEELVLFFQIIQKMKQNIKNVKLTKGDFYVKDVESSDKRV